MKFYLSFVLVVLVALPAAAYQAGAANRTNFGSAAQQPAQQQYRSFSNYNTRTWGKGVQTQGVQTSVAGSDAVDFEAPAPKATKPQPAVQKQAAEDPSAAKPQTPPATASQTPAAAAVNQSANAAAAPAAAMPAEASAMMQQVQGMMSMMGGMVGGAPATGGNTTAGNQAGAAMPAGMPDMSALMGGMMPTQPQGTPVKK